MKIMKKVIVVTPIQLNTALKLAMIPVMVWCGDLIKKSIKIKVTQRILLSAIELKYKIICIGIKLRKLNKWKTFRFENDCIKN